MTNNFGGPRTRIRHNEQRAAYMRSMISRASLYGGLACSRRRRPRRGGFWLGCQPAHNTMSSDSQADIRSVTRICAPGTHGEVR